MEHYVFFAISMAILAVILYIDNKRIKEYAWILGIGLIFAFIFETVTTYLGMWNYYSQPKIPLISLYTWLLYMPYLGICYYFGKFFGDRHER